MGLTNQFLAVHGSCLSLAEEHSVIDVIYTGKVRRLAGELGICRIQERESRGGEAGPWGMGVGVGGGYHGPVALLQASVGVLTIESRYTFALPPAGHG